MAKAYWVATYFGISDPNKMAEYGKLAAPALQQFGAKFLARGTAAMAYEKGIKDRVVLIEFESVDKAVAAHDSPGYQAALKALDVPRDQARSRALTMDWDAVCNQFISHLVPCRDTVVTTVTKPPSDFHKLVS